MNPHTAASLLFWYLLSLFLLFATLGLTVVFGGRVSLRALVALCFASYVGGWALLLFM